MSREHKKVVRQKIKKSKSAQSSQTWYLINLMLV